jgi:sensor domain CHASE-containing protein
MIFNFIFSILKINPTQDLAMITTILALALITIFVLLILNLFKWHQLKKENKRLKQQIKL